MARNTITRADEYFNDIVKNYPLIQRYKRPLRQHSDEAREALDDVTSFVKSDRGITLIDIAIMTHWQACKHVFDFDDELAMHLTDTILDDDAPMSDLEMLPYPIIYVRAPDLQLGLIDIDGFFAWVDDVYLSHNDKYPTRCVSVKGLTNDIDMPNTLYIPIDATFDAAKQDFLRFFAPMVDDEMLDAGSDLITSYLSSVVNLMFYLCPSGQDIDVVYNPNPKSRKPRQSDATIHKVGQKLGWTLNTQRMQYDETNPPGDGTKSPHIRRAHWHHYWIGARDSGNRKRVPRWIPPTFVNPDDDDDDDKPTTIHKL